MLGAFRGWAVPDRMRIDNGKDFTSKIITGVTEDEARRLQHMPEHAWQDRDTLDHNEHLVDFDNERWVGSLKALSVDITLARPYEPWTKPIERWFRTFDEQCGKHFATWCGDKPQTKPECLPDVLAGKMPRDASGLRFTDQTMVPTMDEARVLIGSYINKRYHVQPHRGRGCNGKTPLEVWRTLSSVRRVEDETLALLIGIRGLFKVGKNGVTVTVGGGPITYGRRCHALWRYKGRKVLISVDPVKPQLCYAIDPDTNRMIGQLEPDRAINPSATTDDVREAIAEVKRDQSIMHKARRSSVRRTRTMADVVNESMRAESCARRSTGTEDATASIAVVQTGFEAASKQVRALSENTGSDLGSDALERMTELGETPDRTPECGSIWHRIAELNTSQEHERDAVDPVRAHKSGRHFSGWTRRRR